jgi:hypothetical protein
MPRKRRLSDLYVVGTEVTFDDGEGDPIVVYVRKLNPIEHETALRNANAARSRTMSVVNDRASDAFNDIYSDMLDLDRESMVAYLSEEERANRAQVVEAQLAQEGEWAEDNYLQGLQDAWSDGLMEAYAKDPEDEDAKHVFAELRRFTDAVEAEVQAHVDNFIDDLEEVSDDALREQCLSKVINVRANGAWFTEFRRSQIALAVREKDRKTRYFETRSEIDDLPHEVYRRLIEAYQLVSVDPIEGKDSRETDDSLPSSE